MKKLLCYLVIRLTTRRALNAVKIYETIYHRKSEEKEVVIINNTVGLDDKGTVKSKKQEIIDAINYIKSKTDKTKKDKESLYSLETVLKSM
tara:strand:+ start:576 stop:848 length:273 start_codon:yes stop_codon:yes gene_type:complete